MSTQFLAIAKQQQEQNQLFIEQSLDSLDYHQSQTLNLLKILEKSQKEVEVMMHSSAMNENLINDLLDQAKMEQNKFTLN